MKVTLRDVEPDDIGVFYEHQADEGASQLAAVPSRDEAAYREHWAKNVLGNDAGVTKTILADGDVAGNILAFERDDQLLVGYWLGRAFWSKGIASAALAQFLELVPRRPLHAIVAKHNPASLRVLEKCGFRVIEERTTDVEELLLELS